MTAPNLAISELISRVEQFSPEELCALSEEEQVAIQTALAEAAYDKIDAQCSRDPLFWAQNYSATENPHWEKQGRPFIAPFPKKSYFVPLFKEFAELRHRSVPVLYIPKSREMLTSWCLMCYATHRAQWSKAEVVVQTSKEEKASRLVEYAKILRRNQPEWLQKRHPLSREATLAMEWEDGGKLYGIPSGEDQIRMFHPTIVIFDEAAFLPGFEACLSATLPVAREIIAISSAAPGYFGDECSL